MFFFAYQNLAAVPNHNWLKIHVLDVCAVSDRRALQFEIVMCYIAATAATGTSLGLIGVWACANRTIDQMANLM